MSITRNKYENTRSLSLVDFLTIVLHVFLAMPRRICLKEEE